MIFENTPLFSTLIYLIGGTLMFFITLLVYLSYRRSGHKIQKLIAVIFGCVTGHTFAFALPFALAGGNPFWSGWGYIIGIMFVYFAMIFAVPVIFFFSENTSFHKLEIPLLSLITINGVLALSILILDFRPPLSSEFGFVIWNTNPIAGWLTGLSGMIIGSSWFFVFYRNSRYVQDKHKRIRMALMGVTGILFGLIAILVYTSEHGLQTAVGHILFLLSCFIGLGIYLTPEYAEAQKNA
ncbi:MAG: hypothetical protein AAB545_02955 [Patescibacteria group bacterium]